MVRIFLTGYMGAGKTTLGNAFSSKMNLSFIDMDQYIESRFHKTIQQLFAESGEDKFRELEQNILHEVGCFEDVVISTGGGAPCFFDNMDFMNSMGETVFLSVSEDVLYDRLKAAAQTRPILKNKSGEELRKFIHDGLQQRKPFYTKAKYTFCGDDLESVNQIECSVIGLRELLSL
jgi:shikimate kinase